MLQALTKLTFALAASLIAGMACASEPILINFDEGDPPYMYLRNGKAAGVYPAIIGFAMQRIGVPVQLEAKPWKRAIVEMNQGIAGVGAFYKSEERLRKYDFSDTILTDNIAVFFNKAQPIEFKTLADLHGKRVGLLRGWSYGEGFDAARNASLIVADEVGSDRINLLKLAAGRVDAVLAVEDAARAVIVAERLTNIGQSSRYVISNTAHLAFAKSAKHVNLLQQFNKAIATMREDGSLETIVRQEMSKYPSAPKDAP